MTRNFFIRFVGGLAQISLRTKVIMRTNFLQNICVYRDSHAQQKNY
jgi:hypothetical protein